MDADFAVIEAVINEAAQAYRGVIPADCWHQPYMSGAILKAEIDAGVEFWGWDESGRLAGVMGMQQVRDVTLIRHAYVGTAQQGRGIGGRLLGFLVDRATGPLLVGTWAAAVWAIRFYERHGFRLFSPAEKDRLIATGAFPCGRKKHGSTRVGALAWADLRTSRKVQSTPGNSDGFTRGSESRQG